MTGRMQAVLLHAGAGLLQGSAGMHSAMLAEVPMVIMSGESVSFGEDPQLAIEPQWYRRLSIVGVPPPPEPRASGGDVEKIVKLLVGARNPVILTEAAGRDPSAFAALVEFADL